MTTTEESIPDLVKEFKKDTAVISSLSDSLRFESAKKLLAHGEPVLDHIFSQGVELDVHVMALLHKITGENPVPKEHAGHVKEMRQDWQNWASQNHYL